MSLEKKLLTYAEQNYNVMLIGSHGIGKSTVVKAVAERMGMKFKYYSSSTLDPFADLVGIPVPDSEGKSINFCRPRDLEEAEFVFFDELNRAHPRVLNTVLEIIQFKSINGVELKNLKMVWAAINPPGSDYQVEELDPALVDRFHIYISMKPTIYIPYLETKMSTEIAVCLRDWWNDDLNEEQRNIITPRRIEYLGVMIDRGISYRDAIPSGHPFPLPHLDERIRQLKTGDSESIIITAESILDNPWRMRERVIDDRSLCIEISKCMQKFSDKQIFECRDLLEELPKELIMKIGGEIFIMRKRKIYQMFKNAQVKTRLYPKISEVYEFEDRETDES